MGVRFYEKALSDTFKPLHPRKNLVRTTYIDYVLASSQDQWSKLPESEQKEIVDRMRHNIGVARGADKQTKSQILKSKLNKIGTWN